MIRNDDRLIVTHHRLPLHTLKAKVPRIAGSILGILDSGSEVIAMPKYIWEDLRLPLHSDHILQMMSANTSINAIDS